MARQHRSSSFAAGVRFTEAESASMPRKHSVSMSKALLLAPSLPKSKLPRLPPTGCSQGGGGRRRQDVCTPSSRPSCPSGGGCGCTWRRAGCVAGADRRRSVAMNKKLTISIRVSDPVVATLHARAAAAGISLSGIAAKILCDAVALPGPLAWQPPVRSGSARRLPKKVRLTADQITKLNALAHSQGVSWAKIASDAVDPIPGERLMDTETVSLAFKNTLATAATNAGLKPRDLNALADAAAASGLTAFTIATATPEQIADRLAHLSLKRGELFEVPTGTHAADGLSGVLDAGLVDSAKTTRLSRQQNATRWRRAMPSRRHVRTLSSRKAMRCAGSLNRSMAPTGRSRHRSSTWRASPTSMAHHARRLHPHQW